MQRDIGAVLAFGRAGLGWLANHCPVGGVS